MTVHLAPALDHRPKADTDRAAILLHGRRRPPGDMRDLAARIGLLDWRCVFPAADDASWYPHGFMKPLADNEGGLQAAIERITAEIERLRAEGFSTNRILVGGFSQGACVACEFLARRPDRYMAALILRGGRLGPPGMGFPPTRGLSDLPVVLTAGSKDPWVPSVRVKETADWLASSGAASRLEIFSTDIHGIEDQDADAASVFVERLETG